MALLTTLTSLFGCNTSQKKHGLSDITCVSVACGHMDRTMGYSFSAYKEDDAWYLDSQCFTRNYSTESVLKKCKLGEDEATELLGILEKNNSISYVKTYKKPKKLSASDGESYSFVLTFSDGEQYAADTRQDELEAFFYRLTESYGK